ncbi:hypothetical protein DXG01_009564 [Tephrocybe rancida]|nr:hypothetical protein DXG01_009564 [Tephrocybe rancida]
MSTQKTNILILGATGYIGGSVLARFLDRSDANSLNFTALVRSPEKAEKFKTVGVNGVVGSHEDGNLVEKLASEADVVLSIVSGECHFNRTAWHIPSTQADCDYLPAAQAILKGLEKRFKATGNVPILIHTGQVYSHAFGFEEIIAYQSPGVLVDNAAGAFAGGIIYDDANPDQIETLASSQPHRIVDLEILKGDAAGYVKSYIILPSTIYGLASNKLVDLGIQNPHSIQIPALIDASLDRGQGGMVVADLYTVLYNSIKTNSATGHGREGFYFGENGEHTLYDIGKAVSEALVELGKSKSPEPTPFSKDEIDKYFGVCNTLSFEIILKVDSVMVFQGL